MHSPVAFPTNADDSLDNPDLGPFLLNQACDTMPGWCLHIFPSSKSKYMGNSCRSCNGGEYVDVRWSHHHIHGRFGHPPLHPNWHLLAPWCHNGRKNNMKNWVPKDLRATSSQPVTEDFE
ncbi:hypothetical protein ZEAMMB73_Zm00001d005073 [Zea mays]|uniref:Uncharacterized protein n=1 Tax=Zea mays TaxID=4577 RepID=A0A1D6EJ24_MAIZE|nr:hypothetical protein ZEAMMB73_Zm00001d005073 [Zea mays]